MSSAGSARHVLLTMGGGEWGFEYGMLRDFEDEVIRLTGAAIVPAPAQVGPPVLRDRIAHGTRYAPLRRFVPKRRDFAVDADVAWVLLMGPEASSLDLLRGWDRRVGFRILYLFDTFAVQLPAVRRLVAAAPWDLLITSFHCAVPMLERETQRRWHAVAQGVKRTRFEPVPASERVIAVSSYGRRLEAVHEAIDRFCADEGLHYDQTVAASLQRIRPRYLYRQYSFHMRHSWFTASWPVELTHPVRAGALSPITCRWFEAAAAATTIVGRAPADPAFRELFGDDMVLPLDPSPKRPEETREALAALWAKRADHLQAAERRRADRLERWTWEARVREILDLAKLPLPRSA